MFTKTIKTKKQNQTNEILWTKQLIVRGSEVQPKKLLEDKPKRLKRKEKTVQLNKQIQSVKSFWKPKGSLATGTPEVPKPGRGTIHATILRNIMMAVAKPADPRIYFDIIMKSICSSLYTALYHNDVIKKMSINIKKRVG